MDKDQLIQRLMATFREELDEHVRALNRDLLTLKKEPGAPTALKDLFRTAHSLKGAARSVNLGLLEGACHRLEEILAAVRDQRQPLDAELFGLLFATADAFEEASMRLREQQELAGGPLAALLPQLEAAIRPRASKSVAPPPTPAEPAPRTAPKSGEVLLPSTSVRVAADKLDALLTQSGELLVARRRVHAWADELLSVREQVGRWKAEWHTIDRMLASLREEALPPRVARVLGHATNNLRQLDRDLERLASTLARDSRQLDQVAVALDADVRRVRMLPFAHACQGLERTVHDLAQAAGKDVELVLEGGAVELDRSVLEGLKDPLRHLVRNAVDHGAETAERRRALGKGPRTRITVAAVLRGAQVEVAVADDGRGLDLEALRAEARKKKLPEPADPRELARLVFLPGLSTAPLITDVSGRGIGLDIVKSQVEALHGTVELSWEPDQGTRFTLAVPLTLTTLRALLVQAGGQTLALVGTNVVKLLRFAPGDLRWMEGREMLALGGTPLPVVSLAGVLGLPEREAARPDGKHAAVVVAAGERRMVFAVDAFVAEQEIVVKNLGRRIRRVRNLSGTTLLPSGRIALVLNAGHLLRSALAGPPARELGAAPSKATTAKKRILIAEDSVTTRTLEKSILEAAGYDVAVAVDGAEAWEILQERGADLVVSDVDMPRMDGFALTEAVRGSKRFRELPVVLVTSQEKEQDKARGVAVGASAYLIKSAFDQRNLLGTIAQLV